MDITNILINDAINNININEKNNENDNINVKPVEAEIKPYQNISEMIVAIISFSSVIAKIYDTGERRKIFEDIKQKLFLTAKTETNYLLDFLTKYEWNDTEMFCLLIAIGYAYGSHRILNLFDMLDYAQKGLIKAEEVISVLSLQRSKLFSHNYLTTSFHQSDFIITSAFKDKIFSMQDKEEKEESLIPKLPSALKSISSIRREMSKYVIGQEAAKTVLARGLFEHILAVRLKEKQNIKFAKKNILLLGPTGCGKTYLCQTLAKIANIPIYIADATRYSAIGYKGDDVENIIRDFAYQINYQKKDKLPLSIIFIDEFDKLKFSPDSNEFDMKRQVQEGLLKMFESDIFRGSSFWFDISNVLFIVAGAFSDLQEENKKQIGFSEELLPCRNDNWVKRIKEVGFLPELLGRLPFCAALNDLTKEDLIKILKTSKDSPVLQYQTLFKDLGEELIIPDIDMEKMAQEAIEKGTGARSLNAVFGEYIEKRLDNIELPKDLLADANF